MTTEQSSARCQVAVVRTRVAGAWTALRLGPAANLTNSLAEDAELGTVRTADS